MKQLFTTVINLNNERSYSYQDETMYKDCIDGLKFQIGSTVYIVLNTKTVKVDNLNVKIVNCTELNIKHIQIP